MISCSPFPFIVSHGWNNTPVIIAVSLSLCVSRNLNGGNAPAERYVAVVVVREAITGLRKSLVTFAKKGSLTCSSLVFYGTSLTDEISSRLTLWDLFVFSGTTAIVRDNNGNTERLALFKITHKRSFRCETFIFSTSEREIYCFLSSWQNGGAPVPMK